MENMKVTRKEWLLEKKTRDDALDDLTKTMELNIDLSRFKVFNSPTLFPMTKEQIIHFLSKKLCPVCMHKLYMKQDGSIYFCKSKFKDKFVVKAETLANYTS
jgi:hypothetical protein